MAENEKLLISNIDDSVKLSKYIIVMYGDNQNNLCVKNAESVTKSRAIKTYHFALDYYSHVSWWNCMLL